MKYWFQRYRFFSKLDKGILMDRGQSKLFIILFNFINFWIEWIHGVRGLGFHFKILR